MKKMYLLLLAGVLFFSCSKEHSSGIPEDTNEGNEKYNVSFSIEGLVKGMQTRAAGNPGSMITDPLILDSLIKNVRILVLEDGTGKCLAYGDFDPIRISLDSVLYMTVPVQTLDFIILTNVTDPEVMSTTGLVGANRNQILAKLKSYGSVNPNYFKQAEQIFYYNAENVEVKANPNFAAGENKVAVPLVRMVSQLETKVKQTEVFAVDVNGVPTGTAITGYITSIDTIMLRNVSPDINMSKLLNNQAPTHDASNSIVVNTDFDRSTAAIPFNKMLSFPNEQLSTYPFVIIAATIDPNNAFNTNPDKTITRRYWALQLKEKFLRENVRLELLVKRLLGQGGITPPPPSPTATCEFDITVYDWDPVPDTEEGDAVAP